MPTSIQRLVSTVTKHCMLSCCTPWSSARLQRRQVVEKWTMYMHHWWLLHKGSYSWQTAIPWCQTFNVKIPPVLSSPSFRCFIIKTFKWWYPMWAWRWSLKLPSHVFEMIHSTKQYVHLKLFRNKGDTWQTQAPAAYEPPSSWTLGWNSIKPTLW